MLSVKDLHASVGEKEILRGINLEVRAGEVHAIMGPNGSGKSNIADAIQIPWETIHHVEGVVTRQHKVRRQFVIVLKKQGNSKRQNNLRFSSKDAGKVLKLVREHLGNDKVVKAPTLVSKVKKLLTKRKS